MIFTIGYGAQKSPRLPALQLEELGFIREQLGAVIVDVRARPYSKWRPEMNKPALEKRFGDDYRSRPERGNQLRELPGKVCPTGIAWLKGCLALQRENSCGAWTPLLMCLEKPPMDCHRHHAIAMRLPPNSVWHLYRERDEWTAVEAHELQRAEDADGDYQCLPLGEPFNADFLRSAGILPWPDEAWGK